MLLHRQLHLDIIPLIAQASSGMAPEDANETTMTLTSGWWEAETMLIVSRNDLEEAA